MEGIVSRNTEGRMPEGGAIDLDVVQAETPKNRGRILFLHSPLRQPSLQCPSNSPQLLRGVVSRISAYLSTRFVSIFDRAASKCLSERLAGRIGNLVTNVQPSSSRSPALRSYSSSYDAPVS
ncbi:hypothetical protein FRC02_002307 [Tulasnella sp. 418]|nr:hypothetical protein FRC02_002307 [Tulasnella sp. 418]